MTDRIKIERGVPLPPARNKRRYPYHELAVGDSFFIPTAHGGEIANQAYRWSLKLGCKFETRKRPGGVRVWRTA